MSHPRLSYILAVHNDEPTLPEVAARLVERLDRHPGSEVILVENGSTDGSARVCAELSSSHAGSSTKIIAASSAQGLGLALRRGLELCRGDYVCLTASDLPFGFSDLDAVLAIRPLPRLAIGSKAHRNSVVETSPLRRAMSFGFRMLRAGALGVTAGDTQGSLFLDAVLAQRIRPLLRCDDFLVETEIVAWAVRMGQRPVEVPVVYPRSTKSTVSPLRDSLRMAAGVFALRRRLGARPAVSAVAAVPAAVTSRQSLP